MNEEVGQPSMMTDKERRRRLRDQERQSRMQGKDDPFQPYGSFKQLTPQASSSLQLPPLHPQRPETHTVQERQPLHQDLRPKIQPQPSPQQYFDRRELQSQGFQEVPPQLQLPLQIAPGPQYQNLAMPQQIVQQPAQHPQQMSYQPQINQMNQDNSYLAQPQNYPQHCLPQNFSSQAQYAQQAQQIQQRDQEDPNKIVFDHYRRNINNKNLLKAVRTRAESEQMRRNFKPEEPVPSDEAMTPPRQAYLDQLQKRDVQQEYAKVLEYQILERENMKRQSKSVQRQPIGKQGEPSFIDKMHPQEMDEDEIKRAQKQKYLKVLLDQQVEERKRQKLQAKQQEEEQERRLHILVSRLNQEEAPEIPAKQAIEKEKQLEQSSINIKQMPDISQISGQNPVLPGHQGENKEDYRDYLMKQIEEKKQREQKEKIKKEHGDIMDEERVKRQLSQMKRDFQKENGEIVEEEEPPKEPEIKAQTQVPQTQQPSLYQEPNINQIQNQQNAIQANYQPEIPQKAQLSLQEQYQPNPQPIQQNQNQNLPPIQESKIQEPPNAKSFQQVAKKAQQLQQITKAFEIREQKQEEAQQNQDHVQVDQYREEMNQLKSQKEALLQEINQMAQKIAQGVIQPEVSHEDQVIKQTQEYLQEKIEEQVKEEPLGSQMPLIKKQQTQKVSDLPKALQQVQQRISIMEKPKQYSQTNNLPIVEEQENFSVLKKQETINSQMSEHDDMVPSAIANKQGISQIPQPSRQDSEMSVASSVVSKGLPQSIANRLNQKQSTLKPPLRKATLKKSSKMSNKGRSSVLEEVKEEDEDERFQLFDKEEIAKAEQQRKFRQMMNGQPPAFQEEQEPETPQSAFMSHSSAFTAQSPVQSKTQFNPGQQKANNFPSITAMLKRAKQDTGDQEVEHIPIPQKHSLAKQESPEMEEEFVDDEDVSPHVPQRITQQSVPVGGEEFSVLEPEMTNYLYNNAEFERHHYQEVVKPDKNYQADKNAIEAWDPDTEQWRLLTSENNFNNILFNRNLTTKNKNNQIIAQLKEQEQRLKTVMTSYLKKEDEQEQYTLQRGANQKQKEEKMKVHQKLVSIQEILAQHEKEQQNMIEKDNFQSIQQTQEIGQNYQKNLQNLQEILRPPVERPESQIQIAEQQPGVKQQESQLETFSEQQNSPSIKSFKNTPSQKSLQQEKKEKKAPVSILAFLNSYKGLKKVPSLKKSRQNSIQSIDLPSNKSAEFSQRSQKSKITLKKQNQSMQNLDEKSVDKEQKYKLPKIKNIQDPKFDITSQSSLPPLPPAQQLKKQVKKQVERQQMNQPKDIFRISSDIKKKVQETEKLIEYDNTNLIERIKNHDKFITPVNVLQNQIDIATEDSRIEKAQNQAVIPWVVKQQKTQPQKDIFEQQDKIKSSLENMQEQREQNLQEYVRKLNNPFIKQIAPVSRQASSVNGSQVFSSGSNRIRQQNFLDELQKENQVGGDLAQQLISIQQETPQKQGAEPEENVFDQPVEEEPMQSIEEAQKEEEKVPYQSLQLFEEQNVALSEIAPNESQMVELIENKQSDMRFDQQPNNLVEGGPSQALPTDYKTSLIQTSVNEASIEQQETLNSEYPIHQVTSLKPLNSQQNSQPHILENSSSYQHAKTEKQDEVEKIGETNVFDLRTISSRGTYLQKSSAPEEDEEFYD